MLSINKAIFSVDNLRLVHSIVKMLLVDNPVAILVNQLYTLVLSSKDVIHSWTIPSFGVKSDAIPGRISVLNIKTCIFGNHYGQCSELCGVGHARMPIHVISGM